MADEKKLFGPDPIGEYARFLAAWLLCERQGFCDRAGGEEFQRILREWLKADRPRKLQAFIRKRANLAPHDDQEPPG